MLTKTLISTHSSAKAVYAAYENLSAAFLKAHKRAAQIELFIGPSVDNTVYELRVYSKPGQETEVEWFQANAGGVK